MNPTWQKRLIWALLSVTLFIILPSVFYYSKPLDSYISAKEAKNLRDDWTKEFKNLNTDISEWIVSYCHGLKLETPKINAYSNSKKILELEFVSSADADQFEKYFPYAQEKLPSEEMALSLISRDESRFYLYIPAATGAIEPSSIHYTLQTEKGRPTQIFEALILDRATFLSKEIQETDLLDLYFGRGDDEAFQKTSYLLSSLKTNADLQKRILNFTHAHHPQTLQKILSKGSDLADKPEWASHDPETTTVNVSSQEIKTKLSQESSFTFKGHPFFDKIQIDYSKNQMTLTLQPDVKKSMTSSVMTLLSGLIQELQLKTGETLSLDALSVAIPLSSDPSSPLFVTRLVPAAEEQVHDLELVLKNLFKPLSEELKQENYSVVDVKKYASLSPVEQEACFIIHAPSCDELLLSKELKNDSVYIIGKNLERLFKEHEKATGSESRNFIKDYKSLEKILSSCGFRHVSSDTLPKNLESDLVFQLSPFYQKSLNVLAETQKVLGSRKYAVCELKTTRDHLSLLNKKEAKKQEALIEWNDLYYSASNRLKGMEPYEVAPPTKGLFSSNLFLNVKKYFRGDERKIVKFGLDLSGGKNIMIQLEDAHGKKVTSPEDIKQSINELYERVNKMGVSEVSIRQEGDYISLDFPGSQNLSASELVSGSTMQFHVVNEEFSLYNPDLAPYVYDFLSQVWHEAQALGHTDPLSLQRISARLLNAKESLSTQKLAEKGLRLARPDIDQASSKLDTSLSRVVKQKQSKPQEMPLVIVFHNYALEGIALNDIRTSYDPSRGNFLSFHVQKELKKKDETSFPQERFYEWTHRYSKGQKSKEVSYKPTHGWRMAVLLNHEVVSAPVLESALKDHASITGSFTPKEILKLKADLQAGSLSFQPKIISEQTISPELGAKDKTQGLSAMAIAFVLVSVLMVSYYRFSGFVATCALIVNLLMLWAASAYFGVTLSLSSIAGIVLTLGMAVDANVLVFERMREELEKGFSLKEAVHKGYKKAFSAIFDSNLTTMIAAFVLLSFDAGPIKGFSLTLLVGIITSMITALMMTRFFFFEWVQKTRMQSLNFSKWFVLNRIDFLKGVKPALILSLIVFAFGTFSFYKSSSELVGMDFKGGYALDLKLEQSTLPEKIEAAFMTTGLNATQVHTRQLSTPTHVRVFLDPKAEILKVGDWKTWINTTLTKASVAVDAQCLKNLNHSVSKISGQMSETMKNQAILGLLISLVAIFVYVMFRFEWPFALAATLALVHDVFFTLALMAILSLMHVPLTLDMSSVAALLTIIGYSLNDTIIVFDRIREELAANATLSLKEIIQKSLNATLSRTLLTSGTTLIVLIPMVILGHGTLFNFACVMSIGVVFGTLSTLYLAAPLLCIFAKSHRKLGSRV